METSEPLVLVGGPGSLPESVRALHPERPKTPSEVWKAFERHSSGAVWLAWTSKWIGTFMGVALARTVSPTSQRLLVFSAVKESALEFLRAHFAEVVHGQAWNLLARQELMNVLSSARPSDLFVGVLNVPESKSLVLLRGDLTRVAIPWDWFRGGPKAEKPDFDDVEVVDGGNTLRLGSFEAGTDAVLYEYDSEFRKRLREKRRTEDRSFGASLRRLRLQRGLRLGDIAGLSAKEVGRLERGEIKKPHSETLALLAKALQVQPDEIETY